MNIPADSSVDEFIKASVAAGDSVLYRLYQHVKSDDGHISEQISKTGGNQVSAKDLTWSFANILSAMQAKDSVEELLQKKTRI